MFWKSKHKRATSDTLPVVDPNECIYAVGDIHGRHDLLDALFEKIVEDSQKIPEERNITRCTNPNYSSGRSDLTAAVA